jgi:hypothetical protein
MNFRRSCQTWKKALLPSWRLSKHFYIRQVVAVLTVQTTSSQQLISAKEAGQKQLARLQNTLDDLDELGDIMTEMLQRQQSVEVCSAIYFMIS